jgi:hypothetical protein
MHCTGPCRHFLDGPTRWIADVCRQLFDMALKCLAVLANVFRAALHSSSRGKEMNNRLVVSCVVFVVTSSTTALAQNTLGEVLDAGGKKLTKEEIVAAVAGANISGPTQAGGSMQADYKSDGTFSGSQQTTAGKGRGRFGTWTVDDSGMYCTEITVTGAITQSDKSCGYLFKLGDQYFIAVGSDDRGARVLARTIKK